MQQGRKYSTTYLVVLSIQVSYLNHYGNANAFSIIVLGKTSLLLASVTLAWENIYQTLRS